MDNIIGEKLGNLTDHALDHLKGLLLPKANVKDLLGIIVARAGDALGNRKIVGMGQHLNKGNNAQAECRGIVYHLLNLLPCIFQIVGPVSAKVGCGAQGNGTADILHKMEHIHIIAAKTCLAYMAAEGFHRCPHAPRAFLHNTAVLGVRPILNVTAGEHVTAVLFAHHLR